MVGSSWASERSASGSVKSSPVVEVDQRIEEVPPGENEGEEAHRDRDGPHQRHRDPAPDLERGGRLEPARLVELGRQPPERDVEDEHVDRRGRDEGRCDEGHERIHESERPVEREPGDEEGG